jgi:hypothetical protein
VAPAALTSAVRTGVALVSVSRPLGLRTIPLMSSAAAVMNTSAEPDRLMAAFAFVLLSTVRVSVVPLAVYVPRPISLFAPS